jgi:low affinity Fe/Cu permease
MEIDKNIESKFRERTIQPSTSAWERLSNQLDAYERRKRRRKFFYISSAASILLFISIFLLSTKSNTLQDQSVPETTIVKAPIDEKSFKEKLDDIIEKNEVITVESEIPKKELITKKVIKKKSAAHTKKLLPIEIPKTITKEIIAENEIPKAKDTESPIKVISKKRNSRISVNSDALLYSVTHTEEEVIAYYKAHKLDREDVLNTIKQQLRKSNLKIDAKTILAEVERDIDDASFKKNFMKIIKKRVSDIATAIASRND